MNEWAGGWVLQVHATTLRCLVWNYRSRLPLPGAGNTSTLGAAARAPFCLQYTPRPPGPRQVITTTEHLKQFLASEAAKDFVGWVLALNEAVKGRPLSDTCHVSAGRSGRGAERESGRGRLFPVSLPCSNIDSGRAGSPGMMVCRC